MQVCVCARARSHTRVALVCLLALADVGLASPVLGGGQPQRVLSFINTDPESGTTPTAHLSLVIQDCVYEDPVGTSGTFVYIDNLDALVTV